MTCCLVTLLSLPDAWGQSLRGTAAYSSPGHGRVFAQPVSSVLENSTLDPAGAVSSECGDLSCLPACVPCCPPACCPGWTVQADALFLWRSSAGDPLVVGDNGAGEPNLNAPILNADDLDFDDGWGPRLLLRRRFASCSELEIAYFGIDNWTTTASATGTLAAPIHPQFPGGLNFFPGGIVGQVDYVYGSDLYSGEVNFRRRPAPWLSWLVGFRYVEFNENMSMDLTPPGATFFNIDADNHLYGAQIGVETVVASLAGWRLDSWIKAGIYANHADQSTVSPFLGLQAGAEDDDTAFLGELGLTLTRSLTERLGLRIGYQAMWLEGVALAPDQILVTDLTVPIALIDTNGGVFFHGGFVGLEANW